MSFVFELNRGSAVLNFTSQYCQTKVELIDSIGFDRVLAAYIMRLKKKNNPLYVYFSDVVSGDLEKLSSDLKKIYKLLSVLEVHELVETNPIFRDYFQNQSLFLEFAEGLYDYWRKLGRYAIAFNNESQSGIQNQQFIETHNRFENLVLETYRRVTETTMGYKNRVYRQLIAGVNAGLIVNRLDLPIMETYPELSGIATIESIILHPPFITYPKRNTRKGLFQEVFENPLKGQILDSKDYFCYPAKVGKLLAHVYFHKDFLEQGVTLCNLFELAEIGEVESRKPDLIYAYGVPEAGEDRTVFFKDEVNDLYIGLASYSEEIDYFGYMKKMILTLHNLKMLDQGGLPLHGAMAHIVAHSGAVKNVIIIGDSGAGKSETLEALRTLGDEYIKDIKIVFDDMGVLIRKPDGTLAAHGTEIGAFVRLDDLETGYAYKEIDRSIFMNPHKINARLVIPVATYEEITHDYPIDAFLYANNYDSDGMMSFFATVEEAIDTFKRGARMAKGTTQETGLVESYFANPFGPVQRQEQTNVLIDAYFTQLFADGTPVGEVKTKLGVAGNEHSGPHEAALALLEYIAQ